MTSVAFPAPAPAPAPAAAAGRLRTRPGRVFRYTRNALAVVGLVTIVYHAFFDVSQVLSPSMYPTLQGTSAADGDWILSEKVTYRFRSPRRWEIVAFRNTEDLHVMKRVVGLPGERVRVTSEGRPVINGAELPFPPSLSFLHYYAYGPQFRGFREAHCNGGYFVFGDHSKDSQDSRYEGPLDPARITARPLLRIWPPSRFGWVNP